MLLAPACDAGSTRGSKSGSREVRGALNSFWEHGDPFVFRLIVTEATDVTTARLVGRLRDDGVALLADACETARRPLVLDLSELTSASEAAVLLLRRLAAAGVHVLGASQYVRLLLDRAEGAHGAPRAGTPRRARAPRAVRRRPR
jgi:hypothetical protein